MLLSLAFALVAASSAADTLPSGTVRGVVASNPSGLPVPHAVVEVRDGTAFPSARVLTDSLGGYLLRGIAPGRHTLRVHHLEHEPISLEVLVPAGGAVSLELALRYQPLVLDTVRAYPRGELSMSDTVAARRHEVAWVDSRAIEEGAGLESTLANPMAPDPGTPATDPAEVFRVRGSAADLKLVLLDGAPVYTPFHMGGLMDAFEPGVLSSARLYLGGAPARFDGGLSYVMDLSTRGGNSERHSLSGSLDVVSSRAVAEGPLGFGATYLLSGRAVHGAWMRGLEGNAFPYEYADGVARFDVPLAGGVLRATGFANREGAKADEDRSFAGWQNLAGSVRYRGGVLGSEGELTLANGLSGAAVRHNGAHFLEQHGATERGRAALDLGHRAGPVGLRYGASFDFTRVRYVVDEAALGGVRLVSTHTYGGSLAAYADAAWQPTSRVKLRGGVRGDAWRYSPRTTLSPRGSLTWLVGERAAFTVAAGRYHQYVRTRRVLPGEPQSFADTVRMNTASELVVASANHVSVGLDQELPDGVRLGVEGFYKRFRDVPTLPGKTAYNSGMDLWIRRGTGRVTGWVGYTLTWAWSLQQDALTADDIVGRQVLSAGVAAPLGRVARLSARFQYGSGLSAARLLPDSDAGQIGDTQGQPGGLASSAEPLLGVATDEPYLRLDGELSRTWTPRLAGRRTELTPYFRVINALDQREPLFYQSGADGQSVRAVGGFPLLPVLGVQWKW